MSALDHLVNTHPLLWRGTRKGTGTDQGLSTGHRALDAVLPGGGWPNKALVDISTPEWGMGELQLLLPTMRATTAEDRWLVWIAPPYLPYAPALAAHDLNLNRVLWVQPRRDEDVLWAAEKTLRTARSAAGTSAPRRVVGELDADFEARRKAAHALGSRGGGALVAMHRAGG